MKKVRIKGPAIKLNGTWQFKNTVADISNEEYEKNKDYLDVIEEMEDEVVSIPDDSGETDNASVSAENAENTESEETLEELRTTAKELGIKNAHLMGKEKLIEKIEEAKSPLFGEDNSSEDNNVDKKPDDNGETDNKIEE